MKLTTNALTSRVATSCHSPSDVLSFIEELNSTKERQIIYKHLCKVIDSVDDQYYNQGSSPLSDEQYDWLIDAMESVYTGFAEERKQMIGFKIKDGAAVELPYFMASMNKYKSWGEISRWLKTHPPQHIITAKLDGISGLYHNGRLYTRGDGKYGRDISFLIPFLKLPKNSQYTLRGELIIRKGVFQDKYLGKYSNARNLVCGLLNRTYTSEYIDLYNDIDFVIYDIYFHKPMKFLEKIELIESMGSVQMVKYQVLGGGGDELSLDVLNHILQSWKTNYQYEIDGIIVTNNKPYIHPVDSNPSFAFAFKNNVIGVEVKEGVVDHVIWNVSKDKYLKPKIKLKDSVCCNGSNIEYVTGFNAKYIIQNRICNGTRLSVGLSGNVIPHIFGVHSDGGNLSLSLSLEDPVVKELLSGIKSSVYKWSKNKVDLICEDNNDSTSQIKKVAFFFNTLKLKCSLQETTLNNLYSSLGIYKLDDVLSLTKEQWSQVDKVGDKKGGAIVDCIHMNLDWNILTKDKTNKDIAKLSLEYLYHYLNGLQCFPRGFGNKKIAFHLKYLNILNRNGIIDYTRLHDLDYFSNIVDIIIKNGNVSAYKVQQVTQDSIVMFCQGLAECLKYYDRIKQNVKNIRLPDFELLMSASLEQDGGAGIGAGIGVGTDCHNNVVFSGVRDKDKEAQFQAQGYSISDSVNSNTKLLIVKDISSSSSKVKKAKQLGVKIVSLSQI